MAGLLDGLFNSPETMGLLSAAAAMAERSGPSTRPTSFGQVMSSGLLGGMQGYQGVQDAQTQKAYRDMQMKRGGIAMEKDQMEMDQLRAAQEQQKRLSEAYQSFGSAPNISSVMSAPGRVGPTPERAELIPQQADLSSPYKRNLALAQHLESKGLHDQASKLYETAEKYKPKVKSWQEVRQGDQVLYAPYFEDGTAGAPVPYQVAEKLHFANLGGKTVGVDAYTGKEVAGYKNTQSPDSVASNAVAWANNSLSRQRLEMDRANQNQPQFVSDLGGFVSKPNAQNPSGTFTPLAGASPKNNATEDERRAAGLAVRMENSLNLVNSITAKNPKAAKPEFLGSAVSGVHEGLGNWLTSSDRQRVDTANIDALDAALTLATGAAYTKEQLAGLSKSYFPQVGDDPKTIADKQQRFADVIQTAKIRAGRAAPSIDQVVHKPSNNIDNLLKKYGG